MAHLLQMLLLVELHVLIQEDMIGEQNEYEVSLFLERFLINQFFLLLVNLLPAQCLNQNDLLLAVCFCHR